MPFSKKQDEIVRKCKILRKVESVTINVTFHKVVINQRRGRKGLYAGGTVLNGIAGKRRRAGPAPLTYLLRLRGAYFVQIPLI